MGATPPPAQSTGARASWGSKGRRPSPAPGLYPGYAGSRTVRPSASQPGGLRPGDSRGGDVSMPYTERPDPSSVNRPNHGGFPKLPAPSQTRIKLRQCRPKSEPNSRSRANIQGAVIHPDVVSRSLRRRSAADGTGRRAGGGKACGLDGREGGNSRRRGAQESCRPQNGVARVFASAGADDRGRVIAGSCRLEGV